MPPRARRAKKAPETRRSADAGEAVAAPANWWAGDALLRLALLSAAAFAIILRAPWLFSHPRFWAEEGTEFFSYAYTHPWYQVIHASYRGSVALVPRVSSVLAAHLVSLENAPLLTTLVAFAIQMIPFVLVLWGESPLWSTLPRKVISMLVILLAPGSIGGWLNTINSQFYLSLAAFLLLMDNASTERPIKAWGHRILLLAAGLTGAVSCFLTPLFILKAVWEKNREHTVQAGLMVLCFLLQVFVFWHSLRSDQAVGSRFAGTGRGVFLPIMWTKSIIWCFLGPDVAAAFSGVFVRIHSLGTNEFTVLNVVLAVVTIAFLRFLLPRGGRREAVMLLGSFLLLEVLSIVSSVPKSGSKLYLISTAGGERYFYVPDVILILLVWANLRSPRDALRESRAAVCALLLLASLVSGGVNYRRDDLGRLVDRPDWRQSVQDWRSGSRSSLDIAPQGWQMTLPPPAGR